MHQAWTMWLRTSKQDSCWFSFCSAILNLTYSSKWVPDCVCWYTLMRSLKGAIDGWHSIKPGQDPQANLLLLLNTSVSPMFSHFYSIFSICSALYLSPFLTDIFFATITSPPPPHSTIYFTPSVATDPPLPQSLYPHSHLFLFPCPSLSPPHPSILCFCYQPGGLFPRGFMVKLLWSQLRWFSAWTGYGKKQVFNV